MTNEYDAHFYDVIRPGVVSSAKTVVGILDTCLSSWPKTVVDVGCGEGHWGQEFVRHGSDSVLGLDGGYVANRMIPFEEIDLEKRVYPDVEADLGICLEVVEHLSPLAADGLIEWMSTRFNTILFSGGIPGQPGAGHINCQPMKEWANKFVSHDMQVTTGLRELVLGNANVEPWYQQNLLLVARNSSVAPDLFGKTDFDLVLPRWW